MMYPGNDVIGDVFVKHMEPIHLNNYLQKLVPDMGDLRQPSVFESSAHELTTHLLLK